MPKFSRSIWGNLAGLDSAKRFVTKFGFANNISNSVSVFDDFEGDALDAKWNPVIGSDVTGTVPSVAIVETANGVVRITSSDSNTSVAADGAALTRALNWRADTGGLVAEFKVALEAITTVSVFVGLTDNKALEAPIFSAGSGNTLTSDATDAVGFMFDTSMTADTWWLVGVANNTDATAQNTAIAPVAATYETFRIEVSAAGVATFFRNDVEVGTAMTGAVTPSVLLTPVVFIRSRAASSRYIDVDAIGVSALRA